MEWIPGMTRRSSVILLVALSLVWGSTWIANSLVRSQATPLALAALRYTLAAVCLAAAYLGQLLMRRVRGPRANLIMERTSQSASISEHLPEPKKQLGSALSLSLPEAEGIGWIGISLLLGCTMFALPDLALVWAAEHGAASFTPLLYAALPLGLLLGSGALRLPAILAVGATLVLLDGSIASTAANLPWVLPIAVAVALQGASLVFARQNVAGAASLRGCMVQCATAACLLWLRVQLWPRSTEVLPLHRWPVSSLAALCILAGLATATVYPIYYALLRYLTSAQLATSQWMQTLVAIVESALILRLRPAWTMLAAACLLILCTVLLLRDQDGSTGASLLASQKTPG